MNNYIVNWSDGSSQQNFLVTADSFGSCVDVVMQKKAETGNILSIYNTNLSIDKNLGPFVYYVKMTSGSEFYITSENWNSAKDWVYEALGSSVDTITGMGMEYLTF